MLGTEEVCVSAPQDTEGWLPSAAKHDHLLWWDGVYGWEPEGIQHVPYGRSQVPLWHTGVQHLHQFCKSLQWGRTVCVNVIIVPLSVARMSFSSFSFFPVDEMRIIPISNSTRATQFSHQLIRTQGEWEFLHLTVSSQNFSYEERKWEMLTYAVCKLKQHK